MRSIALGVDLGATNARVAVVDRDSGEILAGHKVPLRDRAPAAVVELVAQAIRNASSAAGCELTLFGGIGVGVAGQCLGETGVVLNSPNLGWRDVPFAELLRRSLGLPVRVVNDLSAAAWGERLFGAARGIADVVLVFVGSGIGSGLILGDRLYEGASGVAGELGHIQVRPIHARSKPRRCGCGAMNCLEAYASGMHIAARVREDLAEGVSSLISALVAGDPARVSATVVEEAWVKGDGYARALWDEVAELLGNSIATVVTLLNPARVILGGGVLLGCANLELLVRQHFDARVSRSAAAGFVFERAHLGDDAGVIGAALLQG